MRDSIQNEKQIWHCVYCNNILKDENKLIKYNEDIKVVCEECKVCFELRMPGKISHSQHQNNLKSKCVPLVIS